MSSPPSELPQPPVELWSERVIGFVTFLFSFLSGVGLAAINWTRMGLQDKARNHLISALIGLIPFLILVILLPDTLGRVFGLGVNVGVAIYLRDQMKNDIAAFTSRGRTVKHANWLAGCLIGLAGLVVVLAVIFAMVLFLEGIGIGL